jgi:hypothetical protein
MKASTEKDAYAARIGKRRIENSLTGAEQN